jgi:superoxide dismutase, Cu-Zn family
MKLEMNNMDTTPPEGMYAPGSQNPLNAIAVMAGSAAYPQIRGTVHFRQTLGGVIVSANITGLPKTATGFHGFHLHAGRCGGTPTPSDPFPNADGHFNPGNMPHPRHAGDFPSLLATNRGSAQLTFITDRFTVFTTLGHAVIIHLDPDDFMTQPSGNSGPMIACGMVVPDRGPGPY